MQIQSIEGMQFHVLGMNDIIKGSDMIGFKYSPLCCSIHVEFTMIWHVRIFYNFGPSFHTLNWKLEFYLFYLKDIICFYIEILQFYHIVCYYLTNYVFNLLEWKCNCNFTNFQLYLFIHIVLFTHPIIIINMIIDYDYQLNCNINYNFNTIYVHIIWQHNWKVYK